MPDIQPALRLCSCGSGQPRRALHDAYGIFCAFICDACEPRKQRGFDPSIFDVRIYPTDDSIDAE
ncbi:MAG: hypothetical protein ABL904_09670 [Hyphomicrobiaceae bacterium]